MYHGAKWILLKQKKRSRKSHAWAPLSSSQFRLNYKCGLGNSESQVIVSVDNSRARPSLRYIFTNLLYVYNNIYSIYII